MAHVLSPSFEPMGDLNTTPLIDVMLVLLVMFIVTIPIQTHAIKIDLPVGDPTTEIRPVNLITVARDGSTAWNGQPVAAQQLRAVLRASQQQAVTPELHLKPDADARFEDVDRVLEAVKREHVSRFGFVGNENYRNW